MTFLTQAIHLLPGVSPLRHLFTSSTIFQLRAFTCLPVFHLFDNLLTQAIHLLPNVSPMRYYSHSGHTLAPSHFTYAILFPLRAFTCFLTFHLCDKLPTQAIHLLTGISPLRQSFGSGHTLASWCFTSARTFKLRAYTCFLVFHLCDNLPAQAIHLLPNVSPLRQLSNSGHTLASRCFTYATTFHTQAIHLLPGVSPMRQPFTSGHTLAYRDFTSARTFHLRAYTCFLAFHLFENLSAQDTEKGNEMPRSPFLY